jgi:hypothetical protein
MVVTCLLGMSIPAGPVSKHNPVLSTKWLKCLYFADLYFADLHFKETE